MVNDSWSEAGDNCIIKWNTKHRRVEVWTVVDVPLYKELGAAYNDPYWYRPNNGIRTREQVEQIREYYNKSELPPFGEAEVETTTQALTPTPEGSQAVGHTASNLSVIIIDADMESDPAAGGTQEVTVIPSDSQNRAHQQDHPQADTSQTTTGSHRRELEDGWQRDAITLTEEEYIRKHYYDKAETSNSGSP